MLAVITHTQLKRPDLLERCKESVAAALPEGAEHIVIECDSYETWVNRRIADAMNYEFVTFVDDDDYISPDSLTMCLLAMQDTGLGAAVTNEVEVYPDRTVRSAGRRTYQAATIHPRITHHLLMFRGNLIDPKALEVHNRFGVGIDWFIAQSVIQQHGCVQVPIDGYFWTQHDSSMTSQARETYMRSLRDMQYAIRETWPAKFSGELPVYS
jgi:hypothetical protein